MTQWALKAVIQGGISLLPKSQHWNYLFQKYATKSLDLTESLFELKARECRRHIENYLSVKSTQETPFSVLEIGTGWHPVIPVGLYLCGVAQVRTIDIASLLSTTRVRDVLRLFLEYAERGNLATILPWIHKDRILNLRSASEDNRLSSPRQILEKLNIYPLIGSACHTGLPGSSIDFLLSNTTLEYIPKDILPRIFAEFRRLASPGAVMSHFIVTGDHYADFDHSITPYNFLKYPNYIWRLFNNSVHYQNRLRISDYRRLHENGGFRIIHEHSDRGSPEDLEKIRIAREFQHYSKDDLLVIRSYIVSTRNDESQTPEADRYL